MRRIAVIALLLAVMGAAAAVAAPGSVSRSRTVPCRESIDGTRFPYVGGFERRLRYRLVLGAVSAPPAYLEQKPSPTRIRPWPYFTKNGLVVRAGRQQPVFVSVLRALARTSWDRVGLRRARRLQLAADRRLPRPPEPGVRILGRLLSAFTFCVRAAALSRRGPQHDPPLRYWPPVSLGRFGLWAKSHAVVTPRVRPCVLGHGRSVGRKTRFRYNQGQTLVFGTCRFRRVRFVYGLT
jgi:hypothetical protein